MRRYLFSWVIGSACLIATGYARAEAPPASPTSSANTLLQSRRIGPAVVPAVHADVRAAQGALLQTSLETPARWVRNSARRSAEVPAPEFFTRPPVEAPRPARVTLLKSRHAPALTPAPSIQATIPSRETLPMTKSEPVLHSVESLGGNLEPTAEPPAPPLPPRDANSLSYEEEPTAEDKGNLTIPKPTPRRNPATRPPIRQSPTSESTVQAPTTRQIIMLREVRQAQRRDARIQYKRSIGYIPERPTRTIGPLVDVNAGDYWRWHWHPWLQIPVYSY